uniref:protein-tyrosine-phosphatase n=1 Tax=Leptobrachium leishanense TaxID=445787 RepID=A0A8C5LZP4_9ANUR
MEQREVLQRYIQCFQKKTEKPEDFARDFLNLKRQSAKYKSDRNYSTKVAEQPENVKKNRYKDILPFDHSRVELSLITSDEDEDYINANFIKGVYYPKAYIATQGPLPSTTIDFWRMIWEYNVQVIVNACMEFEMGKKKCERYWVEVGSEGLKCGPFSVQCSDEEKKTDYVIRNLLVTYENEIRVVHQFHYKNWPDHDVPSSVDHILDLINDIRLVQEDDSPPICIHCSAGCGRTGVLCAIDYTWRLLKDKIIPMNFSVHGIIQEMRTQRSSFVQTKEQYELVYNAVIQLFKTELDRINEFQVPTEHQVPTDHFPISEALHSNSILINPSYDFTDWDRIPHSLSHSTAQEGSFQCSSTIHNQTVKPHNGLENVSPLNILDGYNQQADSIRLLWDEPLPNTGPCAQHAPHFGNIPSDELQAKSKKEDINYRSHLPLIRTKSTPFELRQHRHSFMPEQVSHSTFMDFQLSKNVNNPFRENGQLCQNRGAVLSGSLGNISNVPSAHVYVRLTEDPYFSASSSSDLDSPKFADFCVEDTYPDVTKQPIANKLSLELPFLDSSSIASNHQLECRSVTSASNNFISKESTASSSNFEEESPPPLPERTPESFIVANEHEEQPMVIPPKPEPLPLNGKIGTSLEWGGVSQCKVEDSKLMVRSKSVKVRSFRMEKIKNRTPSPPPIPERTEESFIIASDIADQQSYISETPGPSPVMDAESIHLAASSEPETKMTRKKSTKFLRNAKTNTGTSAKPSEPSQSKMLSFLQFGFGRRFAKPKGPRNPPPTWNL